jgi:glycosyltransferase involved in cell wall biosynthesis
MQIRVAIVFKSFASWTGISHIGLNVVAITNARYLSHNGISTVVFPVRHNIDLVEYIDEYNRERPHPLTHVVINAPWLNSFEMRELITHYPDIQFIIQCHSNVGFLQADPWGTQAFRAAIALSKEFKNIHVAGNDERFVDWAIAAYKHEVLLLPNLYTLYPLSRKATYHGVGVIKVGSFGAIRPQKNFMTAAGAAIVIHNVLKAPLEFHISAGGEGDGGVVTMSIEHMLSEVPGIKLVKHGWLEWEHFVELVGEMDLLIQPSYTESFCMVTADGILVGVPSVVSSAITWAPDSWKADSDNALDVADVGLSLIGNEPAWRLGYSALEKHNVKGFNLWKSYLCGPEPSCISRFVKAVKDLFSWRDKEKGDGIPRVS